MQFDLIIVGGGLVGAGLACALRESGLRFALIDASLPKQNDPRLFALNNGSIQFLKNLHLWPTLAADASPIHQVHVSHQGHFGAVRLSCEEVNLPELGYVVPARYIETSLNQALTSLPNFILLRPAKLKSLRQQDHHAMLTIAMETGEQELQSAIVIAADGTDSTVRAQLNIPTEVIDYQQSAIVTKTKLQRSHPQIAYERFYAKGAIAMLPLLDDEYATIWSADYETISQLRALSDEEFLQALQKEFGFRLGRLRKISQRFVFPLKMVRAEQAMKGSVLLLGNAAHTLHPIAAQGFNLALYEVAMLVENMMEKIAKRGSFTVSDLRSMVPIMQKQQATSMGISHRLASAFSNNSFLMNFALQLGMVGLDVCPAIKKRFIDKMMGKAGYIPHLLLSANNI